MQNRTQQIKGLIAGQEWFGEANNGKDVLLNEVIKGFITQEDFNAVCQKVLTHLPPEWQEPGRCEEVSRFLHQLYERVVVNQKGLDVSLAEDKTQVLGQDVALKYGTVSAKTILGSKGIGGELEVCAATAETALPGDIALTLKAGCGEAGMIVPATGKPAVNQKFKVTVLEAEVSKNFKVGSCEITAQVEGAIGSVGRGVSVSQKGFHVSTGSGKYGVGFGVEVECDEFD